MILRRGSRSEAVKSVQQMLTSLGFYPQGIDGVFGKNTEKAVIRFQESWAIYADGVVGPITMEALEQAYQAWAIEHVSPGVDATDGFEERLAFVRVPADLWPATAQHDGEGGYNRFYLRQDVADAYMQVYDQVQRWGGILTSSGARRSLRASVSYNRSATSFHYTGRALDLFVWSALDNPGDAQRPLDPYVVRLLDQDERRLEVFVRCTHEDVPEIEIDQVLIHSDPGFQKKKTVVGRFKSLTQLFEQHGFKPIRYRRRFEDNGDALAAEWWHFQYEVGLIPLVTTFGSELLRVYSLARLQDTPPWRFRERIYQVNWF